MGAGVDCGRSDAAVRRVEWCNAGGDVLARRTASRRAALQDKGNRACSCRRGSSVQRHIREMGKAEEAREVEAVEAAKVMGQQYMIQRLQAPQLVY